jgi:hypothetical protein
LLIFAAASSGCATTSALVPTSRAVDGQAVTLTANGLARTTGGGRTQKVGLPLPPAAKIGLWAGVAVMIALAMADDEEDASEASSEP